MKLDQATISGQLYLTGKWLAWDVENTAHGNAQARDPRNYLVCTAWTNSSGESGLFYGDLLDDAEFNKQLRAADFLIVHGGKHEASWLKRAGIDPKRFVWADTLLFEWILLGNNPEMLKLGLDPVSYRHGFPLRKDPRVQTMFDAGVSTELIPLDLLERRCQLDVAMTVHTFMSQIAMLADSNRLAVAATACLLMPVLACMEAVGITVSKADVLREHTEAERLAFELTAEMRELVGGEFNEASPNEMLPLVFGLYPATVPEEARTVNSLGFKEPVDQRGNVERGKPTKAWPEGRPVLNKSVLEQLEKQAKTPRQKRWVELRRQLSKQRALLSKNLDFFLGVVTEQNGKFYAQLMQGITATHRLSSLGLPVKFDMFDSDKSVQVQNVPRSLKYLQQCPDKDYLMFDVDGMQLEFRVAAFCGNDAVAKADIMNPDFDAHIQTLTCMLNKGKFDAKLYADLLAKYRGGDKKVALDRADNVLCKSHCFPLHGTEYLTPGGWRTYEDLQVGDVIIGYNINTDQLEHTVVEAKSPVMSDDVIELRNRHNWGIRCTNDHPFYGDKRIDRGSLGRVIEKQWFTAATFSKEHRMIIAAPFEGGANSISADDAARLAWLWCDGSEIWSPITGRTSQGKAGRRRGAVGQIIQKDKLQEVRALFGIETSTDVMGIRRWNVPAAQMRQLYESAGLDPLKPNYSGFVLSLNKTSLAAFVQAVIDAEGTPRKHGEHRIAQNAGPLADAIKLAIVLSGNSMRTTRHIMRTGNMHEQITMRKSRTVGGSRVVTTAIGKHAVACIKTPLNTVVVRQKFEGFDSIQIAGNTFKPLFGGRSGTKVQVGYYDFFNEKYKGIAHTQAKWLAEVEQGRPIITPTGMQFHFNVVDRFGKCFDAVRERPVKPSAYNYPIQYFAGGELIPISIIRLVHAAEHVKMRVVFTNTVHDSITGYVHKDDVQAFVKLVGECFTDKVAQHLQDAYGIVYDVPLGVEIKIGKKLGEGEKFVCSKRVFL